MMNTEVAIRLEEIDKHFGATYANRKISMEVQKGEIRGLAGENGSGKSTLVSILSGIYKKDSGVIYKGGKEYDPKSPQDAACEKIGIIVQELGMVSTLPIGINMFLGRLEGFKNKAGLVDMNKIQKSGNEILKEWGLGDNIPLAEPAGHHSVETRKLAELARALSLDPEILIIDEMTQALSHDKRAVLYDVIKKCKDKGIAVIIISHDLEELVEITDTITVLRDGAVVDTVESNSITPDDLKRMMVGREISNMYYRTDDKEKIEDEVLLKVQNISDTEGIIKNVSFDLHKGEILAICGLSDAGIHNLGRLVVGLDKKSAGSVYLTRENVEVTTPQVAMKNKMGYLPKDRDKEAMMLDASIRWNFAMPSLKALSSKGAYLSPGKMTEFSQKGIEEFQVKCQSEEQACTDLSGGNKQKINFGRWVMHDTEVYILDCPTRGVDVGVKAFIYEMLIRNKEKGCATLLIADELPEAMGMADRILVMKNGSISREIWRSEGFTEEAIVEVML